ncbi:unnamed protein product [Rhizophagus irregularis]|nr:unnamed protein product [Rhizophagus irregularis]
MSENRRRTIGRPKSSWIWEFFDSEIRDGDKWAICKLDKIGTDIPCKKEYKTCGSTKNCIDHLLNKHDLCKDGQKNNQQISQTTTNTNKMHNETHQLELRQFLVDFVLNTSQPLRIVECASLRQLLQELDPLFAIPDSKSIKAMINLAYNHTFEAMINLLHPITSVYLTLDLWTARSNNGYLGITCSFLDQQYNLKEMALTISHVRYPHTAENINDAIEEILEKWDLRFKVPKQSERLEDIQKSINESSEEIRKTDKYLRTIQDCEMC